jgi:hypothetical protein
MAKKKRQQDPSEQGKRHHRSPDITCLFCKTWIEIHGEYRNPKAFTRYCKLGSKDIDTHSETCDSFDLTGALRCPIFDFDSCPSICLHKQKTTRECRSCFIGVTLYRYLVAPPITINIIGGDDDANG